jgi:hypothetical protein
MHAYDCVSTCHCARTRTVPALILLAVLIAPLAAAQDTSRPDQTAASQPAASADSGVLAFLKRTQISGFADIYYDYNFNTPLTRQTQLRNFDVQHNSFSLNLLEISLEKRPTADSRAGFRIDLDYGPTATAVHASEPGGTPVFQNIGQAYVSYLAPAGKGLQFDVGEFVTPMGNEAIKTKDNWNYSRSFLFTLAEPYYHMGLRVTSAISDRITLSAHLVNGWNDVVDNNAGKTIGVQVSVRPASAVTITQTYMAGPEQVNNDSDWRQLSDTVVTYAITPRVSVVGSYDYGQDTWKGERVRWQGVAGYLRYQPRPWFALSPRIEYYDDRNGFTSGAAQRLQEATLTAELRHRDGVLMRIEYRRDVSNLPFFARNVNALVKDQPTFTVGLIYAFSSGAQ